MNDIVIGTLLVENILARVLFDPRATHSFISIGLASQIIKLKEKLDQTLLVNTPLGKVIPSKDKIRECKIKIGEGITRGDLMILDIGDFDIILGMD